MEAADSTVEVAPTEVEASTAGVAPMVEAEVTAEVAMVADTADITNEFGL
jgi:hypothetical protein